MFVTDRYEECKYISPNTATVRPYKQAVYSRKTGFGQNYEVNQTSVLNTFSI